jgi:hypothetical protein
MKPDERVPEGGARLGEEGIYNEGAVRHEWFQPLATRDSRNGYGRIAAAGETFAAGSSWRLAPAITT